MADETLPPNPYPLKHRLTTTFKGAQGEREETVDEVAIRRATGEELLLIDQYQGRPMGLVLEMIARLSDLTPKQVRRLDAEDIGPLGRLAFANVEGGQPTGETVSDS